MPKQYQPISASLSSLILSTPTSASLLYSPIHTVICTVTAAVACLDSAG